ncbi:MAG: hypothetical protein NZ553_13900 [Caldilinea sp.]|nr:hypothetical protein [Caldilinea sp.]MDW8441564.1 hypothetical protein [Caldilineaceae bacterium]
MGFYDLLAEDLLRERPALALVMMALPDRRSEPSVQALLASGVDSPLPAPTETWEVVVVTQPQAACSCWSPPSITSFLP